MPLNWSSERVFNQLLMGQKSRLFASIFHISSASIFHISSASSGSASATAKSLDDRITCIRDPKLSIVPVLDKWVDEGRPVEKEQLQSLVKLMRDFNRFKHALEISLWMSDRRFFILSPSDAAVRLDLIKRVHGLGQAENYFNSISKELKNFRVYSALLNAYVQEKLVEKAEALMEEMRLMGSTKSSYSYNILINLYSQTGQHKKIGTLMQEMNKMGIPQDQYTMRNLLAAYVSESNVPEMERILNEIEKDPNFYVDWKFYSIVANGYIKAGSTREALAILKKMESKVRANGGKSAFEFLLSLYAKIGDQKELYRIWNSCKPSPDRLKVNDSSYGLMIRCLQSVDDITGAERIFEEWESQCTSYDFRVLNSLLNAYCRKGLFDKAESAANRAAERGSPYPSTWNVLAMGYYKQKQMRKAVEMLKKALSISLRREWRPSSNFLEACMDHLEEESDAEGMEELVELLKNSGLLTKNIYQRLRRTCVAAGKSASEFLHQLEEDGFAADGDTEEILLPKPLSL